MAIGKPRRGAWTDPSLGPAEETSPEDALTWGFWLRNGERMNFRCLRRPGRGVLSGSPNKLTQG